MEHPANFPKILYCFPECAGKSFVPSNGTEGMVFIGEFCERCVHEKFTHTQDHADFQCDILTRSLLGERPEEWKYSGEGYPICTKWKFWDWGSVENGLNVPPEPEIENPNQLKLFQ